MIAAITTAPTVSPTGPGSFSAMASALKPFQRVAVRKIEVEAGH